MNAKTKGLLQILKNASVPDTAPPPIPLKLAEELCTLVWKEKWELDAAAYAREVKFPPLPEVMLDAFIQSQVHSHGIRSLAIKYFKSVRGGGGERSEREPRKVLLLLPPLPPLDCGRSGQAIGPKGATPRTPPSGWRSCSKPNQNRH